MGLDIVLPPPVFMSLRLMQYIKDGKIFKKACFCLTFWVKCAPQIPWTNTLLSYKRVNSSWDDGWATKWSYTTITPYIYCGLSGRVKHKKEV